MSRNCRKSKIVSRAYLPRARRTLLAIRQNDKEVAVKLVAVIGALGIGALFVLLGLKHKKSREDSAS
jgi:hypothetical protein